MRMLILVVAVIVGVVAGVAIAAQRSDRITVSPTLPKVTLAPPLAVDAATSATLAPGLAVFASGGEGVGRVVDVVRTPAGQINRVLIDTPDGKRRALSGAAIKVEQGKAVTTLSQTAVLALPEVKP